MLSPTTDSFALAFLNGQGCDLNLNSPLLAARVEFKFPIKIIFLREHSSFSQKSDNVAPHKIVL